MDTVATAARRLLLNARHDPRAHVAGASSPTPGRGAPPAAAAAAAPFPMLLAVFILFVLHLCFLSIFLLRDLLHFFSLWLHRRLLLLHDTDADAASDAGGSDAHAHAPRKPAGLDPAVLATFPTVRFEEAAAVSSARSAPGPVECAVCLSEFNASDAVRLLTVCRHAFHTACIDSWLGAHTTCPVCRSDLDAPRPPPGHQEHSSDVEHIAIVVDEGPGAVVPTAEQTTPPPPANNDSGGARSRVDRMDCSQAPHPPPRSSNGLETDEQGRWVVPHELAQMARRLNHSAVWRECTPSCVEWLVTEDCNDTLSN